MYIRGLIPRFFTEMAEAIPIVGAPVGAIIVRLMGVTMYHILL